MNLGDIYSYVDYLVNKDQLGESLDPSNYQILLNVVNSQYYKSEFDKVLPVLDLPQTELVRVFNNSPLYRFLTTSALTVSAGSVALPADLGRTLDGSALLDNGWKYARLMSVEGTDKMKYTVLTGAKAKKVYFTETPSGYNFIPNSITSAKVNYLRDVKSPVFDYCNDADDNIIYMPVGDRKSVV